MIAFSSLTGAVPQSYPRQVISINMASMPRSNVQQLPDPPGRSSRDPVDPGRSYLHVTCWRSTSYRRELLSSLLQLTLKPIVGVRGVLESGSSREGR